MMRWICRTTIGLLPILDALLLAGCGDGTPKVRVGAKDFIEQQILAEMAAQLLRAEGVEVAPVVPCGDSYSGQAMLREGEIDLMVEYSGTGLNFLGVPADSRDASLETVRRLYEPLGLRWLGPLGFDNSYCVLVPSSRAAAIGLETIGDLADPEHFPGGIRVACPPEYLRRPGDGLAPLLEAYGLTLAGPPIPILGVVDRVGAVQDGRADVAIGYRTDGVIAELGLRVLEDPRGFFPPYEAAFVVRDEAIDRVPELLVVLDRLEAALGPEAMRRLNYAVEVQGRRPAEVALEFLRRRGLVPEVLQGEPVGGGTVLAVAVSDEFGALEGRALLAIRTAFPGRPVRVEAVDDPAGAIDRGEARLVLMGAGRFFPDGRQSPSQRERRVEAVAVVGSRLLHIVRRADDIAAGPFEGRIGLTPDVGGAGRVADRVIANVDDRPSVTARGRAVALLGKVRAGEIDVALILAAPGDGLIAETLSVGDLALASLPDWLSPTRAVRLPELRPALLPAGTYAHQDNPIETLGEQVVLAGPSREASLLANGGGPLSALQRATAPLSGVEVEALADATGVLEAPAPTLPSAWNHGPPDPLDDANEVHSAVAAILNMLAIAFLGWLVLLIRAPASAP